MTLGTKVEFVHNDKVKVGHVKSIPVRFHIGCLLQVQVTGEPKATYTMTSDHAREVK